MEILTKIEYENIKALQRIYCKGKTNENNHLLVEKYSHLSIRKKYELIKILYDNLISSAYPSQSDNKNAEKIVTDILLSITDEFLDECQIISEDQIDTLLNNKPFNTQSIDCEDREM